MVPKRDTVAPFRQGIHAFGGHILAGKGYGLQTAAAARIGRVIKIFTLDVIGLPDIGCGLRNFYDHPTTPFSCISAEIIRAW